MGPLPDKVERVPGREGAAGSVSSALPRLFFTWRRLHPLSSLILHMARGFGSGSALAGAFPLLPHSPGPRVTPAPLPQLPGPDNTLPRPGNFRSRCQARAAVPVAPGDPAHPVQLVSLQSVPSLQRLG